MAAPGGPAAARSSAAGERGQVGSDRGGELADVASEPAEAGLAVRFDAERLARHGHAVRPGGRGRGVLGPERGSDLMIGGTVGMAREVCDELEALAAR